MPVLLVALANHLPIQDMITDICIKQKISGRQNIWGIFLTQSAATSNLQPTTDSATLQNVPLTKSGK